MNNDDDFCGLKLQHHDSEDEEDPIENQTESTNTNPNINIQRYSEKKTLKEEKCCHCSNSTIFYDKFSCQKHVLCEQCLYRTIFCNHLEELTKNENGIITVKCYMCGLGEMKKSADDIYEIIQKKLDNSKHELNNRNVQKYNNCNIHQNMNKNYYCLDCRVLVCSACVVKKDNPHNNHRIINSNKLKHFLKATIKDNKLMFGERTTFLENLNSIGRNIKSFVDGKFFNTLRNLDELINSAIQLRKEFEQNFKEKLTSKMFLIKILKLYYMDYLINKEKMLNEKLNNNTDIGLLQFLSDINQEFANFTIHFDNSLNDRVRDIKSKIDFLKTKFDSFFKYEYTFVGTKRQYMPDEYFNGIDNGKFNPCIAQCPNETIVTAGNFKMKFYEQFENDNDELKYKQNNTIEKMVGNVFAMIVLKDNRIVTSGDGSVIKIFYKEGKSYQISTTLAGHTKIVTALAKLSDGRFLSGSHDKTIIVWKPIDKTFEIQQILQCDAEVLGLMGSNNLSYVLATQPNGPIVYFRKNGSISFSKPGITPTPGQETPTPKPSDNPPAPADNAPVPAGGNPPTPAGGYPPSPAAFAPPSPGNAPTPAGNTPTPTPTPTPSPTPDGQDDNSDYVKKQVLNLHKGKVWTLCEINENTFASGGQHPKIALWKIDNGVVSFLYKVSEHKADVTSIIKLKDGNIASASCDHTIKIWKIGNLKKLILLENITGSDKALFSLIQLKDERLCSISSSRNMILWKNRPKYY